MGKINIYINIVSIIMLSLINILPSISYNELNNNFFQYKIKNDEIKILKYIGNEKNISIPEIIDGKIVTSIEKNAFTCNKKIEKIYIPYCIKNIEQNALFTGNSQTIIEVSSKNLNYYSYGGSLYSNDKKTLVRWCEKYGDFRGVLASVENIGEYAFAGCNKITNIDIPNNIKSIGDYAFANCSNVVTIKLSSSMTRINPYSFFCCKNLKKIYIPNEVYEIQDYAFAGCTSIENITIPNKTFLLGEGVFYNCINLKKINIPGNILELKSKVFYGCKNLESVIISNNEVIINDDAFDKDSNVKIIYRQIIDESDYDKEDEKINYFQKSNEKMYKDNKDEIEKQQLDVNNNFKYIISHSAIILFVLIVICLILFRNKKYI